MHLTSHSNTRNTYLLADTGDIDVEDRKYTAGESGNAKMCNMYCSKMGYAHVRYPDCEQAEARACVEAKSFCVLPAWHKPELKLEHDDEFLYVDGYKFECAYHAESDKMHHIFVLDCSGSMSGRPWEQLVAASTEIEFEAQDNLAMLQALIPYRGGGTTFSAELRSVSEVMSRNHFEIYKPVVVFFSDGQPHDPKLGDELATHIRQSFAKYDLKAFVVGYDSISLRALQRMTRKLSGLHHNMLVGTARNIVHMNVGVL